MSREWTLQSCKPWSRSWIRRIQTSSSGSQGRRLHQRPCRPIQLTRCDSCHHSLGDWEKVGSICMKSPYLALLTGDKMKSEMVCHVLDGNCNSHSPPWCEIGGLFSELFELEIEGHCLKEQPYHRTSLQLFLVCLRSDRLLQAEHLSLRDKWSIWESSTRAMRLCPS